MPASMDNLASQCNNNAMHSIGSRLRQISARLAAASPAARSILPHVLCRVCRSPALEFKERVRSSTQAFDLYRCKACGTRSFYPDPVLDYIHHTDDEISIKRYVEATAAIDFLALNVMSAIGSRRSGRLLDIGCGFGFAADAARRLAGWSVVGVEPSAWGRRGAKALRLDISDRYFGPSHPLSTERFDLIHASEVLEHICDPVPFLELLKAQLAVDGILVLTTPNGDALDQVINATMRGAVLSVGAHAVLFSKASLESTLTRIGFANVDVSIRGCTLVAFASDTVLALAQFQPAKIGADYAAHVLEAGLTDADLNAGMRFRRFRHLVELGQFADADAMLDSFAAELSAPFEAAATIDDYAKRNRFYLGQLMFYVGILRMNHAIDYEAACLLFMDANRICREKIRLDFDNSVFEQDIQWRALQHAAMCHAILGRAIQANSLYTQIVDENERHQGQIPADLVQHARETLHLSHRDSC